MINEPRPILAVQYTLIAAFGAAAAVFSGHYDSALSGAAAGCSAMLAVPHIRHCYRSYKRRQSEKRIELGLSKNM